MRLSLRRESAGSVATVWTVGAFVGVLLMLGLALLLHQDREARIEAAHRQALALATGVDRLLQYGLRNIERAMAGIAADASTYASAAPEHADALLREAIDGVVSRNTELESVVLVDARGEALMPGQRGDPDLPEWTSHAVPGKLVVGALKDDGGGAWRLRVAWPFGNGRWLLGRMRAGEIERMIRDLDIGRDGSVAVLDRHGVVLARLRDGNEGGHTGYQAELPEAMLDGQAVFSELRVSQLDGIERMAGFSATSGYALVVAAGIGLEETLAAWYRRVAVSAGIVLLYWLGLVYLASRLRSGERVRRELMDELEAQADWLDQAQQASGTGVWRQETEDGMIRVSAHNAALFGFEAVPMVLPAERFFERMHPDDRARVQREFAHSQATGEPYHTQYRVLLGEGVERWISANGGLVVDSRGRGRITGTIVDITEQRQAQARVERAEAQFRALFERNPLPFWVFDAETLRFLAVNDAAISSYGYSREEFLDKTIFDIRPVSEREAVLNVIRSRPHGEDVDGVWTHLRRDGSAMEVRIFSSGIEFGGRPARLVLAEDVGDRMSYERDLAWRAAHDDLTGLTRLSALVERLDAWHASRAGERFAVACVRLRELDLVASALGQRASESILVETAARVSMLGERFGMSAFWPGESFVVVALDAGDRDILLAALQAAFAVPVEVAGGVHPVEVSIGVAEGPAPGERAEQVIGHAALAAIRARQERVLSLSYDATMAEQAAERLALVGQLRDALRKEAFSLVYQPILRLADDRLVALEALLRWRLDDGTLVPPGVFVPLAEASGLIVPLGRWVLEQAARSHGRLADGGLGHVAVAVNVSAQQLLIDSVPEAMRDLALEYGLPRGALHVELTESVLLRQPQLATARMLALRNDGVHISIDDFGTGFSSMSYLRTLPVDALKIDRSFVRNVHLDARNASICSALIALAHGLGLGTIAEGVESAGELEWLRQHGCDQAQGYFLGRPAPLDDWLDAPHPAA
ncbi:MAG: EAL domain-containing protein [Proteobacteria bacterium]|nr:EAL domain-containing protein [Pseudomonadota bacterium]